VKHNWSASKQQKRALAKEEEQEHRSHQKFLSRMAYPLVLIHAAAIIPSFVTYVKYSAFLALLETLFWLSPFYIVGTLYYVFSRNGGLDGILLRVPFWGESLRQAGAARFCRNLSALMRAGIRIEKCFYNAALATGNEEMKQKLQEQIPALEQGVAISHLLERSGVFPKGAVNLLAAAELSGTLDSTLDYLAEQLSDGAGTASERATMLLPALCYIAVVLVIIIRIFIILGPLMSALNGLGG
jgi:type II secretory pathway component PulF